MHVIYDITYDIYLYRWMLGVSVMAQGVRLPLVMSLFHIGTPVWVLVASLYIQLLANVHEKSGEDGSNTWVPLTHVRDLNRVLAANFSLHQPWLFWPLGESSSRWNISFNLRLSLCLSHCAFQINKSLLKDLIILYVIPSGIWKIIRMKLLPKE